MSEDCQPIHELTPPPQPSPVHRILFGPHGLRVGWRVAIFALLFAVFEFVIAGIGALAGLRLRGLARELRPGLMLFAEAAMFAAALAAAAVMRQFERRPFGDYGLPWHDAFGRRFWTGALWGWVALTVLLLALRADGNFFFGALTIHGATLAQAALSWAAVFLCVGFAEEFLFRGYPLTTLVGGMGFWPAAIFLSVVFGAGHLGNTGEDWIGALSAGLIGLFLCFTVRRTGHLWFAVGFHFFWDYAETFLYSVPNSGLLPRQHLLSSSFHGSHWLTGGSVGPEGSLLVFPLIGLLFLLFHRAHPAPKPMLPA